MATHTPGELVSEGKTKKVFRFTSTSAVLFAKDDITAGDGAKHDVYPGFGRLSNVTTCNVFRLLVACGIPAAFREQIDDTSFEADLCEMIPLEVIIRREAHGSALKRFPHLCKGHLFPRLVFELFLKTSGRKWKKHDLPCDDPYTDYTSEPGKLRLFLPSKPLWAQEPFLVLDASEVSAMERLADIENITRRVALILEKALQLQGIRFADFKIEFGFNMGGELVVADVIDSSSWRIVGPDGKYIDKQAYRDGGEVEAVFKLFERGLNITSRFVLPRGPRIIVWYGSDRDDQEPMRKAVEKLGLNVRVDYHVCSAHKQPVAAYLDVHRMVQETPNCVVIACIGRSNGAGPTLAANMPVPVISVPTTWKECPEDVWSSLRTPSENPNLTVLDPGNALLAALNILGRSDPYIYSELRLRLEKRLTNVVELA